MPTLMAGVRCERIRPPQTGYTLIEAVVAIAVVSVALLGVFQVLAGTLNTNADSRSRALATRFAERRLEAVRETDFADLTSSQGNTDDDLSRRLDDDATWDLTVANVSATLKAVTVTVHWSQGTRSESLSLSTLAHQNGISHIRNR